MALDEVDMAFAWWRQTSGPRRLLRKLTSNSLRGLCSATSNIADENFLEVFAAGIMEEDSAVIIDHEQVDENTSDDDFLHTLLDKYASPDYVIDLLSDSPFLDMAAKGALKHRIIFVTFCGRCSWAAKIGAAYNKGAAKAANSGALIFLTDWLDDDFPSGCGVDRLSIADYVTTYDYQSYAAHLLAERGMKDGGKRIYTAGLTAAIAAPCNDFSLVPALALPQLYREPLETARRILSDNFVEEQVLRNLWEMQMQTVMPITHTNLRKNLGAYFVKPRRGRFRQYLDRTFGYGTSPFALLRCVRKMFFLQRLGNAQFHVRREKQAGTSKDVNHGRIGPRFRVISTLKFF